MVRGVVTLPHGTGKDKAAFVLPDKEAEASS
jgi:ribosomal protein L1